MLTFLSETTKATWIALSVSLACLGFLALKSIINESGPVGQMIASGSDSTASTSGHGIQGTGEMLTVRKAGNVRARPSAQASKLGTLQPGAVVERIGEVENGKWFKVRIERLGEGYMWAGIFDAPPKQPTLPTPPFTVTSNNVHQFSSLLCESQIQLIRQGHQLPVRSTTPAKPGHSQPPFPNPQSGEDILMNHQLRPRGIYGHWRRADIVHVDSAGSLKYTFPMRQDEVGHVREGQGRNRGREYAPTIIQLIYSSHIPAWSTFSTSYPIDGSAKLLAFQTYSERNERPRKRRAISVLDIAPRSDAQFSLWQIDGFLAPVRLFNLKYLGRSKRIVPYSATNLAKLTRHSDYLFGRFPNPIHSRYELRPVYIVEAIQDTESRLAIRVRLYVDPTSWAILMTERIDAKGKLWKFSEYHSTYERSLDATIFAASYHLDIQSKKTAMTDVRLGRPVKPHSEQSMPPPEGLSRQLLQEIHNDEAAWPLP